MVKVITLYQDITFTETRKKTEQDKLIISKKPLLTQTFKTGTSVFRERPFNPLKRVFMFWKKRRDLMIIVDGNSTALNLELKEGQKPTYNFNFGTIKEAQEFIDKSNRKSRADSKPISTNQFLVLALLLGAVLMFQFMNMKGVTF